jgi:hypothetical protein
MSREEGGNIIASEVRDEAEVEWNWDSGWKEKMLKK